MLSNHPRSQCHVRNHMLLVNPYFHGLLVSVLAIEADFLVTDQCDCKATIIDSKCTL